MTSTESFELCDTCKYRIEKLLICRNPKVMNILDWDKGIRKIDMVTGSELVNIEHARSADSPCGEEGKLYEESQ